MRRFPSRILTALLGGAAVLSGLRWHSAREARRAETEFPPIGSFVSVDGLRLHYLARGSGRPVILLHGIAGSLHDYAIGTLRRLARDYHALAFDRPGHGYSQRPQGTPPTVERQAEILHGALKTLGIENPLLVGHSWGGALTLAYALRYPEDLSGIVLLAPAAYGLQGYFPLPELARRLCRPIPGDVLRSSLSVPLGRILIRRTAARAFSPDPAPAGYTKLAQALWTRPSAVKAIAEDGATLDASLRALSPRYGQIRLPTAIITGDRDLIVDPRQHSYPLHQAIRHSLLVTLPRTGHSLHITRPEAVAQAVRTVAAGQRDGEAGAGGDGADDGNG